MVKRRNLGVVTGLKLDKDWINNCFMLPKNPKRADIKMSDNVLQWMYFSSADTKFTNTSLGGNYTINNPPQFTIYADPPTGILARTTNKKIHDLGMANGMGMYYSEAIDDNAERISLRFGVPEYKGLITFFTGFYNGRAAMLANQGRLSGGIFYLATRIIGGIVMLPLDIIIGIGRLAKYYFGRPSTKFYWSKPAMPVYWGRVNFISNSVAANLGLVPRSTSGDPEVSGVVDSLEITTNSQEAMNSKYAFNEVKEYMPELFRDTGGIDVYRMVNKTARMSAFSREILLEQGQTATSHKGLAESVKSYLQSFKVSTKAVIGTPLTKYQDLYHKSILGATTLMRDGEEVDVTRQDAISDRLKTGAEVTATGGTYRDEEGNEINIADGALGEPPDDADASELTKEYASQDNNILSILRVNAEDVVERALGWVQSNDFVTYYQAAITRDSEFISFKIDPNATESETWQNNVGEGGITESINGLSSTARGASFSFSNFKTGFGIIDGSIQAAKDMIYGALDSFHLSSLLALAGTGYVDIPKRYMDSTTSFSSTSYTIELRSAYGDPLSIYLNIYLPFICLMAGALPVSHGNQAYGAPMLCELYHRGHNTIRLGMIESLSVTRGAGTVGWNEDGLPLGLDVSFSVVNLTSIMHAPIDTGIADINPLNALLADDNAWSDYLSVLSNLSIDEQTNPARKLAINWSNYRMNWDSYFDAARVSNNLANTPLTRLISNLGMTPPAITTM